MQIAQHDHEDGHPRFLVGFYEFPLAELRDLSHEQRVGLIDKFWPDVRERMIAWLADPANQHTLADSASDPTTPRAVT